MSQSRGTCDGQRISAEIQVTYQLASGHTSKAYLDEPALPDGSYVGTNKHTDLPVHLRYDEPANTWREVCTRHFNCDPYTGTITEVGERPPCSCVGHADGKPR